MTSPEAPSGPPLPGTPPLVALPASRTPGRASLIVGLLPIASWFILGIASSTVFEFHPGTYVGLKWFLSGVLVLARLLIPIGAMAIFLGVIAFRRGHGVGVAGITLGGIWVVGGIIAIPIIMALD